MKRLLSDDEMLQLIPADDDDLFALAERMRPLRDDEVPPWLTSAVKTGEIQVSTVVWNERKVAVFWHWYSAGNKTLMVNAAGSLVCDDIIAPLLAAIHKLAHQLNATAIQFQTKRLGLIEKTMANGFKVDGVVMRKDLI
jgi:hypothetical protein